MCPKKYGMPVRKTERKLPDGISPDGLGQAEISPDGQAVLVSFIVSPLVIDRPNTYVVFVMEAGLSAAVHQYEWSLTENDGTPVVQTTAIGELVYVPQMLGSVRVQVKLVGTSNEELATLILHQEVIETNSELEDLILASASEPGPGIGNLAVARELINDHNPYYQTVSLQTPETGDGFKQFVFSMASDGVLQRTPAERANLLDQLAAALNENVGDFATLSLEGAGVCRIRLALLALVTPGGLVWTELPDGADQRLSADEQLRQRLAALDENKKIDLFNLVRFPKSNINQCGKILEALRDRYFPGTNFSDVLTGLSGTRAHWLSRHYREGPIQRAG